MPPRRRTLMLCAIAALAHTTCASREQRTMLATPAALHAPTSAPSIATDAAAPSTASAQNAVVHATPSLPPLFATMRCAGVFAERAADVERPSPGAFALGEARMTFAQLRERPWLWGQSGSGCGSSGAHETNERVATAPEVDRGTTAQRALAVAREYLAWGRVDDELRWAPFLCRMPRASAPTGDLAQSAPHGRKVYYLYARNRLAYVGGSTDDAQIVVKEAWRPHEIARGDAVTASRERQCVGAGERCVEPGEFAGLYVMLRGVGAEPTDAGWTYATVSPEGAVTASGLVSSCMGCHQRAPRGRLFGRQSSSE